MSASTSHLIAPHGGELVDLLASPEKAAELKAHSREWPSWDLTVFIQVIPPSVVRPSTVWLNGGRVGPLSVKGK